MSDQLKLYLVSLIGIEIQRGQPIRYGHVALLMDGQSIEIVKDEACHHLNEQLPASFKVRHAHIRQIGPEQYQKLIQFAQHGLLTGTGEPLEESVQVLCNVESPDPEDIIFEFNELPM
jgi:hypothetical protein